MVSKEIEEISRAISLETTNSFESVSSLISEMMKYTDIETIKSIYISNGIIGLEDLYFNFRLINSLNNSIIDTNIEIGQSREFSICEEVSKEKNNIYYKKKSKDIKNFGKKKFYQK